MSRYPPIPPSELNSEQHAAYDESSRIAKDIFGDKFIYKNDDGAFIGPFGPLLYTPNMVNPFFKMVVELGKCPGIPAAAKETAILATGSTFKAGYELYAHGKVAEGTSLTGEQISNMKGGKKPDDLDESCQVAFDVAIELSRKQGPLSDETFQRASKTLGKQGTAALIHYVALYAYTCIFLNGVAAPVPE
ncbi:hypothetical protein PMZ80_003983 [Knufia obscura]|uniref:Carboxymuconolactone decarboxylase-like domain-containing protein n=2 Tax=Knufia TaxID=430999 RepID=A0AAN8ECF9_9EURO|nr:hypothetical protein PMZ80_003983 [Knufia obscura]KAK5952289.1 hypothetical protein OHC33_006762 [Knufia fluminis]